VYGVLIRPPFPAADRSVEIAQVVMDRRTGEMAEPRTRTENTNREHRTSKCELKG